MKLHQEQHRTLYEVHTLKTNEKWQQLYKELLEKQGEMKRVSEQQMLKTEKELTKLKQKLAEVIKENQQKGEELERLKQKVDQTECRLLDQERRFNEQIQLLKREFSRHDQPTTASAQQQEAKPTVTNTIASQGQPDNKDVWEFTVDRFTERKTSKAKWESPVMMTPRGYKLLLEVWPNGQNEGRGTHVSVWLQYQREEGDEMKWPARVTMNLELLKQSWVPGNTRKMIIMESFDIECDKYTSKRRYHLIGTFSNTLIAHKTLSENQQFLKDDSLKMKITLLKEQPIETADSTS